MLFYPLYQQAERQDNLSQTVVHKAVTEFVDAARTKGYITPKMYLEFSQNLGATGNVFDVKMEHLHKKYNPDYADPADPNSFKNSFKDYYDGHYTEEIMEVLFPDNSAETEDSDLRRYKMGAGDFFTVKVRNENRTMATIIFDFLTAGNTGDNSKIVMNYGGMVINEDWNEQRGIDYQ